MVGDGDLVHPCPSRENFLYVGGAFADLGSWIQADISSIGVVAESILGIQAAVHTDSWADVFHRSKVERHGRNGTIDGFSSLCSKSAKTFLECTGAGTLRGGYGTLKKPTASLEVAGDWRQINVDSRSK